MTVNPITGAVVNGDFHVESLRDEDCFDKSSNVYEVTHILSKKNNCRLYDTLNYIDKRYNIEDIPDAVKGLVNFEKIAKNT